MNNEALSKLFAAKRMEYEAIRELLPKPFQQGLEKTKHSFEQIIGECMESWCLSKFDSNYSEGGKDCKNREDAKASDSENLAQHKKQNNPHCRKIEIEQG